MKKFFTVLAALLIVAGTTNYNYGQTSKEDKKKEKAERKAWKQRAKEYKKDPLALRDELESLQKRISECNDKNKDLQGKYATAQAMIDSLEGALAAKDAQLASLTRKYEQLQTAYEAQKNVNEQGIIPGLVYKVQIGAFVHFDMNKYLQDTDKNFEGETQDGMNKYTMGAFRDMEVAEAFRKDVQLLGIKDAWIVPYIDGTRVTMEEAREYIAKQGS